MSLPGGSRRSQGALFGSKNMRAEEFVVFRLSMNLNKNNDLHQALIWFELLRCKTSVFRLPSLTLERVLHFAS